MITGGKGCYRQQSTETSGRALFSRHWSGRKNVSGGDGDELGRSANKLSSPAAREFLRCSLQVIRLSAGIMFSSVLFAGVGQCKRVHVRSSCVRGPRSLAGRLRRVADMARCLALRRGDAIPGTMRSGEPFRWFPRARLLGTGMPSRQNSALALRPVRPHTSPALIDRSSRQA